MTIVIGTLEGFISQAILPCHYRKIILGQKIEANRKIILGWREYVEQHFNKSTPLTPSKEYTIQLIEFALRKDRFSQDLKNIKYQKFQSLIYNTKSIFIYWNIKPQLVIITKARGTTWYIV